MSDRSFRDRLARIADNIDLEQLDGLVNRSHHDASYSTDEDQPSLQRLFLGLEENGEVIIASSPASAAAAAAPRASSPAPPPNAAPVMEDVDAFFAHMPDYWGLMGGHRTPLNRAIKEGKFDLAEKLISSSSQTDSLNDGSMTHALTTGKGVFHTRRRNLKIVKLLLEKGASPNFRSPNVLELPAVTPFEVAINFYLDLLKHHKNPRAMTFSYERTDLMNTIGLSGEDWLELDSLISQGKELILLFLEHGADINLQTTNAGRTIFHEVMSNEASDFDLIYRMVSMGALINLTDVHGTTPLMDVVRNTENASKIHSDLTLTGKRLLIDAQNCIGETVLWRSMLHGRLDTTRILMQDSANACLTARVQGSLADYFVGSFGFRPFGITVANYRKRPLMKTLPALLAPLLFDSPCCLNERNKTGQKNGPLKLSMLDKFSVTVFNQVIKSFIAPIVDSYGAQIAPEFVSQSLADLIVIHTDFKHLIEEQVFQTSSLVSLMFGNASAGLRQHCLRQVLYSALFNKSVEDLSKTMQELQGKIIPLPGTPLKSCPKALKEEIEEVSDEDDDTPGEEELKKIETPQTASSSENVPRVRSSTPFPARGEAVEDGLNRYDENWYLGESPQYGQPIVLNNLDLEDTTELELSHQDNGRQTVTRLQRMLQETDDRLEKLQSQVLGQEDSETDDEESDEDFKEEELEEPRKKPSSLMFSLSPFGKLTPKVNISNEPDPRFDEAVVRLLTPSVVEALRIKLGLPPGLRAYLELEVARLQLGASLFHHSTIKCDRGCEGNDEESELTSSDEEDDDDLSSTTSWDDSLSEPTSNENQHDSSEDDDENDSDVEHVPTVPERPRILSSSSSSSSDNDHELSSNLHRLNVVDANAPNDGGDATAAESPDFFSFGGRHEHSTIMAYVQQMVQGTFDHSTESETEDEMPPLE